MCSKETHNDLEHFFVLSNDILCIAGTDGYFKKINQSFIDLMRYSEEELLSKQFVEFVHPDDVEATLEQVAKLSDGREVIDFENRYRSEDGQYHIISWAAQPSQDKSLIYAVGRNVTNERNAQAELSQLIQGLKETTIYAKTDRKGVIIDANHRLTEVSGYTRDELIGKTHSLINSGVHDRAFFDDLWTTISAGRVWTGMIENKAKDGTHYFVNSIIVPIKNLLGNIESYIAFRFDVTPFVETKKELSKALSILNETSEIAKVGGWELDIATGDLFWTDETFRILEVTKKDNQRPTLPEGLSLFTAQSKPIIDEAVNRCINFGEPYFLELEALTAKGNKIWVFTNGAANYKDGKVVSLSGTIQNIDARKKAEMALEKSEHRYRGIVENTEDLIAITDAEGKLTFTNKMANTILGLSAEEALRVSVYRIFHPQDREGFSNALVDALNKHQKSIRHKCRIIGANDNVRMVSWNLQILYNKDQSVSQIIGIGRDVTEQQKLEQDLKLALQKAQNADRAKTDFLANMSHEIRTPMNGILMSLNLAEKSDDPAKIAKLINTASASTSSLLQIINDILDFSKLESGKVTIEEDEFNPKDLLTNITELMSPLAENKGIKLSAQISDDLKSPIMGDKIRINQVLNNLVSNAIKFSEKGTVLISGQVVFQEGQPKLRVEVKDNGPGVSQGQQEQLFKRFSQLAQNRMHATSGTGLGLAISKQLIDLMAGEIGVTSDGKNGSTFWFELPFNAANPNDLPLLDPNNPPLSQSDLNILLVEDVDFNRDLITMLLELYGHKISTAVNGYDAVDILLRQKQVFDLILMDNHMPFMTGIQASYLIRSSDCPSRRTPIIALTADVLEQRKMEIFEAGINGFIAKPVNEADLNHEISRVMSLPIDQQTVDRKKNDLFSIIYISRCTHPDLNVINLLKDARQRNQANDITGVLWIVDDYFIQVLEGEMHQVYETLARICQSQLHTEVQIVFAEAITKRSFNDWSMAFPKQPQNIQDYIHQRLGQTTDLYAINREQLSKMVFATAKFDAFYETQ